MIQFKGFKPDAMQRIAGNLGYQGDMNGFNEYLSQNPDKMNTMNMYQNKAMQMAKGGMVKQYAVGGLTIPNSQVLPIPSYTPNAGFEPLFNKTGFLSSKDDTGYGDIASKINLTDGSDPRAPLTPTTGVTGGQQIPPQAPAYEGESISVLQANRAINPSLVGGATVQPVGTNVTANQIVDPRSGQVTGDINTPITTAATATAAEWNYEPTINRGQLKDLMWYSDDPGSDMRNVDGNYGGMTRPTQAGFQQPMDANRLKIIKDRTNELLKDSLSKPYIPDPEFWRKDSRTDIQGQDGGFSGQRLQGWQDESLIAAGLDPKTATQEDRMRVYELNRRAGETAFSEDPIVKQQVAESLAMQEKFGLNDMTREQAGMFMQNNPNALVPDANLMTAETSADKVGGVLDTTTAAQGEVGTKATVDAQATTTSSVSDLEAAQGTAILMENPVQRKVEAGELISGVANAETASKFTEEVQAATATPTEKATVQGQLDTLMQDFEGGATPTWAAGAMRAATSAMAARGLGASSMAGQAIIQATMEAALPVASADAQVFAQFESQNLSNRQQRAMLAAQQRATFMGQEFDQAFQSRVMNASKISDVANMNFTAEQQVALENSRNANTMNMANLSNRQALTMAEAAALSNLDMSNLNNRQQAAVMNAQSFLQMDMANLNNQQQTSMFKSQQQIQSLFTDQAAANAASQFNASSENQTDQFFANLSTSASQFNASQTNAQNQFNAGQTNAQDRFASEMMNQRDQFNAQNRLVIDQNNANWRRQVATADTASINRANEINAASVLGISNTAYNDLWSYYQDSMEWAWNSAENERQRIVDLASVKLQIDSNADISAAQTDYKSASAWGGLVATMFTSPIGGDTLLGKGLGALTGGLFS